MTHSVLTPPPVHVGRRCGVAGWGSRPVGGAAQKALGIIAFRRLPLSVQVWVTSGEIALGVGVPVLAAEMQQPHSVLTALLRGLVEAVNLRREHRE